ncbi:hypothetical protein PoB_001386900 [Plakobranchus ocellatus]|uniref:Uncharacterized protein n=1 Tax=Plakobranchus ocellatus TaxID=259542 RepID=A0AAV3YZ16_9GAST|nr:hypothetical protein PoB_001386900 [Plakobranchus ocellatus]
MHKPNDAVLKELIGQSAFSRKVMMSSSKVMMAFISMILVTFSSVVVNIEDGRREPASDTEEWGHGNAFWCSGALFDVAWLLGGFIHALQDEALCRCLPFPPILCLPLPLWTCCSPDVIHPSCFRSAPVSSS